MDARSNESNSEKLKPRKRRQRLACHRGRKVQIKQEYDIPFPGKD
jgi:hypothetical protein